MQITMMKKKTMYKVLQIVFSYYIFLHFQLSMADPDPLPSWNEGPAKRAIVQFAEAVADKTSAEFVAPAERIATFDQDGTLSGGKAALHPVGLCPRSAKDYGSGTP